MAIFTLNGAISNANTLKYEQLDGAETITGTNTLPTAAATQAGAGIDKRGLEGTSLQSGNLTPLHATLGTSGMESPSGNATGTQALSGNFGALAANQNFSGVTSALSNPNNVSQSANTYNASSNVGGEIANASTSSTSNSSLTSITNITNNPPTTNPPTDNPNPPTNPPGGDPVLHLPTGPLVAGDINTGILPPVHTDVSLPQIPALVTDHVVAPVTTLVTNTLTDVLTHPTDVQGNVTNLVTGLTDVVHGVLDNSGINLSLGDLNIIGTGNAAPSIPLIYLGGGEPTGAPVATLLDARVLQNLPSLSELKPEDFAPQNLVHTVSTTLSELPSALTTTLGSLLNPSSGPQLDLTLGNNGTSTPTGNLGDIALLNGIPGLGDTPLLNLTLGTDSHAAPSQLLDVNLLNASNSLGSISVPILSENPIISLTPDTLTNLVNQAVSLLNVGTLSGTDLPSDNILATALQAITGNDATQGLVNTLATPLTNLLTNPADTTSTLTSVLTDPAASITTLLDTLTQQPSSSVGPGIESTSSVASAGNSSNVADTLSHLTSTVTGTVAATTSAITTVASNPVAAVTNPVNLITTITNPLLHGLHW